MAFSADGTKLVFVGMSEGSTQLYLRMMDQPEAVPIGGTEGARIPFFSPDGMWVGYFNSGEGNLNKVSILGGPPEQVCIARSVRGGCWGGNNTIYFTPNQGSGIYAVSANGGTPEAVTEIDIEKGEKSHRFPEVLPSGDAIVFTVGMRDISTFDYANIAVASLNTGQINVLLKGTYPRYSSSGHLVYARSGALWAVPFDPYKLEISGDPVRVREGVITSDAFGSAQFALSQEGSLAYIAGGQDSPSHKLTWLGYQGNIKEIGAPDRWYGFPHISPDGNLIAVNVYGANDEVWIYDLVRGMPNRFIYGGGDNHYPCWSPDGEWIFYSSIKPGLNQIFRKPSDNSTDAEQVIYGEYSQVPGCLSPDGQTLVFVETHPETKEDIWVFELDSEHEPRAFLKTPNIETGPALSPDGRWLAYQSDELNQREIFILSFPDGKDKIRISDEGGTTPVWAPDGRELYFLNGQNMVVVSVTPGPNLEASRPRILFEWSPLYSNTFDISPDGEQFLLTVAVEEEPSNQIEIVLNWFDELRQLVPPGG